MYFEYKDYVREHAEYKGMLEEMEQEVCSFMEDFHDDPRLLSGWGHGYFCVKDGARLIYDRKKPFAHVCSICGKVHDDFIYETYYVTMYRNEAIGTAVKSAVLYAVTEKPFYLETVKKIISFYADNYRYFAVHAKEKINCAPTVDVGGAGKIMPQGLNEAIIAIRMVTAMEIVKENLEKSWVEDVRKKLFEPVYELLLPQKMHIHNIPIWLNSAFGIMGLFFAEKEWILEATEHPFHIYEQLEHGLTESGFWYEGSIHYNFFALEGLMTFLAFAKSYDYEIPQSCLNKVKHMLFAAYDYAFDNDLFPNPSDGWPNISLQTYSYVYFMGYKVFGTELLPLLCHIADNPGERGRLPLSEPYYYQNRIPLEQLIHGADFREKNYGVMQKRTSAVFEDYNCAVLRNEVFNVFLKYGHQTVSHAHPDKMNVEIMVKGGTLTRDLSNSGYGTKICNEWDRTIFSHNTCAVNGKKSNVDLAGNVTYFDKEKIEAQVQAYDGVNYKREIQLNGSQMTDAFTVNCQEESVIDWFFHFESPLKRDGMKLHEIKNTENPYFMDVYKVETVGGDMQLENELVKMTVSLQNGAEVYLAKTYNNPADCLRDTLVIRQKGKKGYFVNSITAGE